MILSGKEMNEQCEGCMCLKCKYRPCEDCFKCDLDGYEPNKKCESMEE